MRMTTWAVATALGLSGCEVPPRCYEVRYGEVVDTALFVSSDRRYLTRDTTMVSVPTNTVFEYQRIVCPSALERR